MDTQSKDVNCDIKNIKCYGGEVRGVFVCDQSCHSLAYVDEKGADGK